MKLAVVGDVHENEELFSRAMTKAKEMHVTGVLLVGDLGDPVTIIGDGRPGPERYRAKLDALFDIARTTLPGVQVFFVPGNHDADQYMSSTDDVKNIQHKIVEFEGLTIGGFGGSLPCGGFPTEWREADAIKRLEAMGYVDILLAHSPPFGVLDCGLGSHAIREYVERFSPGHIVFGHIHEAVGVRNFLNADTGKKTICLNAGAFGPPNPAPNMGILHITAGFGQIVTI